MERVLVALVGGLSNGYVGEGMKWQRPDTWRRMPATVWPERFAKQSEIRTIKNIEIALRDELRKRMPDSEITFLPISFHGQFSLGALNRHCPIELAKQISTQIEGT